MKTLKNKLYKSLLLSALILSGCQNEAPASENDEETPVDNSTEQVNDVSAEDTDEPDEDAASEDEIDEEEEVAYQYKINPDIFSVESIEERDENEKLVLLTFDDAPYGNTMEIAEALAERDVSAIFFVNGMYMEDDEGFETMQKVHEMGFEIANHTHTHAKLDDYTNEEQFEELKKTSDIIEEAIGSRPRFFRAPHGIMTDYAEQVVAESGMSWMNWSFGYDWMVEYQDGAALTEITLNAPELGPGSNILMHDREWTADAVPGIVHGLIKQGYTIVDPALITHEE